jgi:hypothetical protein
MRIKSVWALTKWRYFLNESLRPPTAFWNLPSTLSFFPSAVSYASPTALPTASLMTPFACFAAPAIRSLSMLPSLHVITPSQAVQSLAAIMFWVSRPRDRWCGRIQVVM